MRAMVLERACSLLVLTERPIPPPGPGQLLLKVRACAVCRTDLHVVDGELRDVRHPMVPGHQVVGTVEATGEAAVRFALGQRVGVPWLGRTCGCCGFCKSGRENLCDHALFTGCHVDGGFAQYMLCHQDFALAVPDGYPDMEAAPLLCAGLIGYRALRMAGDAGSLGFYGFGAAAHILLQVARWQGREVFAFTKPGDSASQGFALGLGAAWAGDTTMPPPAPMDAALIFAPAGDLIPLALSAVSKGGVVVCAGIHMSDIPSFPYSILWGERVLRSVANLTRRDGEEFLSIAPRVPVHTDVEVYDLDRANDALADLRAGRIQGAAVLKPW